MQCLCGAEFEDIVRGQAKYYCSDRCRQRAKRGRDRLIQSRDIAPLLNQVITGDCRELSKQIPDESIDLIFTDPPYPKEYLPLYGWLAKEAERVLKPGGFLLAYTGVVHKFTVMQMLGAHLDYFTDFIALDQGKQSTILWRQKLIARHKSILAFSKGSGLPRCQTLTSFMGGGKDKRFHSWGQDEQTARYYIDCFSFPDQLVWDPFVGGGTTPVVCKQMRRNFIGFEIDAGATEIARKRLETVQMPLIEQKMSQLAFGEETA
jgi:hypothetical protein